MNKYDFKKAKEILLNIPKNKLSQLVEASIGMSEDWFFTAQTVWEKGEFIIDLDEVEKICGIDGSSWATPILRLEFKDNIYEHIIIRKDE